MQDAAHRACNVAVDARLEHEHGGAVLQHLEVHARVVKATVRLLRDVEVDCQDGHLDPAHPLASTLRESTTANGSGVMAKVFRIRGQKKRRMLWCTQS